MGCVRPNKGLASDAGQVHCQESKDIIPPRHAPRLHQQSAVAGVTHTLIARWLVHADTSMVHFYYGYPWPTLETSTSSK